MRNIHLFILLLVVLSPLKIMALPGDTLFYDDFERAALGADWSTTDTVMSDIGTQTANSGTHSLYTRHGLVTTTSRVINLAVDGAKVEMWVRKGSDDIAGSEDPESADENLLIEYLDNTGAWKEITIYRAQDMAPGEVANLDFQLPNDALHGNFQLRLTQTGGDGSDWDYWHIDDIRITETGHVDPPPPLIVGQCEEFEGDLSNWTVSASRVNITNATANSPTHSLSLNGGNVDATSIEIDTSSNLKEITIWVRRGSDAIPGSEDPDANEDLVVEYLDTGNNWVVLETFLGSGTKGQIYEQTYAMPANAKHAHFKIRLRMTNGSAGNFDYWHVDDVCLVPETYMSVSKSSCVISDPVNNTTNPKRIPGATIRYAIELENITDFDTDNNIIEDSLAPNFDTATIRNLQIQSGACDCTGVGSASNNGAGGTANGVNPVQLDYGTVDANSKECGYFEVDIQ